MTTMTRTPTRPRTTTPNSYTPELRAEVRVLRRRLRALDPGLDDNFVEVVRLLVDSAQGRRSK